MTTTQSSYDPFAPARLGFPERRLHRAGLDEASIARLRDAYAGMDADERKELVRFVSRNADNTIARRWQGARSRTDLEALRVEDLEDLLRERKLSTSGRKAELVDRLLAVYSGAPSTALTLNPVPSVPDTPDADTPASPTSAPETAEEPPAGPDTPAAPPADGSGPQGTPAAAPTAGPADSPTPAAAPAPATETPAPAPAAADSTTTED